LCPGFRVPGTRIPVTAPPCSSDCRCPGNRAPHENPGTLTFILLHPLGYAVQRRIAIPVLVSWSMIPCSDRDFQCYRFTVPEKIDPVRKKDPLFPPVLAYSAGPCGIPSVFYIHGNAPHLDLPGQPVLAHLSVREPVADGNDILRTACRALFRSFHIPSIPSGSPLKYRPGSTRTGRIHPVTGPGHPGLCHRFTPPGMAQGGRTFFGQGFPMKTDMMPKGHRHKG